MASTSTWNNGHGHTDLGSSTIAEQAERYRAHVANAPLIIVVVDSAGRYIEVNSAACRISGYSEAELLALSLTDLVAAESHDAAFQHFATLKQSGRATADLSWLCRDGTKRWCLCDAVKLSEDRFLVYCLDITERKRVESELERMRVLLSEGQRIAHVGSFEYLADTQETVWSDEECRIYGLVPGHPSPAYEDLVRKHIHPDDAAILDQTFRQAVRDRVAYKLEHRIVRPDGSARIVQDLAHPYFDEHQRLVKYIGATLDVTDQRHVEEALRESERRQRAILNSIPDPAWLKDKVGRCLAMNQACCSLLGLREEDAIGMTDFDYLPPEAAARVRSHDSLVMESRRPLQIEEAYPDADGNSRWFETIKTPIFNEQEEVVGTAGVARNITDRKRAERFMASDLDAMIRLQKLGSLFAQDGTLELVLTEIVDAAMAIVGADFGNIQLLDPASGDLRIAAHRGFPQWWLDYWNTVSIGRGCCGAALERGERVIVEDVEESPVFVGTPALDIQRQANVRAVQSTPLVSRSGKPLGMCSTHWRTPHHPDERSLCLLDLLARQAADIIERKQNEELLRGSEERLRLALEGAGGGVWDWDLTGGDAWWSSEMYELWGVEPGTSMRLENTLEVVHPEDRDRLRRAVEESIARNSKFRCEFRIRHSRHGERWVSSLGHTTRDGAGTPVRLVGITIDVTERKARELEVARLNRLYATLSKLNQTIVQVKSREELFREVCGIIAQEAGFRLAWIGWVKEDGTHKVIPVARGGTGQDYLDEISVYADDRPEGRGPTGSCIREDRACVVHDFLDDPRTAPWHATASQRGFRTAVALPIHFQGKTVGALTVYDSKPNVIQDKEVALLAEATAAISTALDRLAYEMQRELAEKALAESNQFNQQVITSAQEGVIVYGPDLRYQAWNPYMERLTGLPASEVLGRHPLDLFPFLLESGVITRLQECLDGKAFNSSEFPFHVPSSGFAGWVSSTQAPLRNSKGEIIGVIGTVRDVTEQKRAEVTLRVAKEAAEAASRAKSEFLANMSHELRTPMTAIMGFADILMMSSPLSPDEQQEFLEGIQSNSQALLRLIDDILDLSRIEADRMPVEKADCPLQDVIDEVVAAVRTKAGEKGLSLTVNYQLPLPKTIYTDRDRLRQILLNLVGNAIKFTECGGIRISVCCLREGNGTGRMQFAVSDTGIGIPQDKINDIFQPFVQVDGSLTRRYGGTGLGLGISQRLAKVLGGDIAVTSQLGQGSTFNVTIDAGILKTFCTAGFPEGSGGKPTLAPTRQAPPTQQAPPPQQTSALHGRVLFAEDYSDVQHLIRFHLTGMGLEVDMADNGGTACEMVEQSRAEGNPYDLILMDIQMPVMDGFEATRWLRRQGWEGPVVALTAFAMVGDREKCLSAGCDDFITKPLTPQELKDVVTRYISPSVVMASAQ
jgi:PAS domain S-box-containing protein